MRKAVVTGLSGAWTQITPSAWILRSKPRLQTN